MKEQSKPVIWKSTLCTPPCLIFFFVSRLISGFAVALIIWLLSQIPIASFLLDWLFIARGDTPDIFVIVFSTTVAYYFTSFVQKKMIKDLPTIRLSRKMLGILIMLFHVLFFFSNLHHEINVFPNVICFVAGLVFLFR